MKKRRFDQEELEQVNPKVQVMRNREMGSISYDKTSRSEFYNNVTAEDKLQHLGSNQLKIKFNRTKIELNTSNEKI